jgi:hypothetical protein
VPVRDSCRGLVNVPQAVMASESVLGIDFAFEEAGIIAPSDLGEARLENQQKQKMPGIPNTRYRTPDQKLVEVRTAHLGSLVRGNISEPGEMDVYLFTSGCAAVTLFMDRTDSQLDPVVALFGPDENLLGFDDDSGSNKPKGTAFNAIFPSRTGDRPLGDPDGARAPLLGEGSILVEEPGIYVAKAKGYEGTAGEVGPYQLKIQGAGLRYVDGRGATLVELPLFNPHPIVTVDPLINIGDTTILTGRVETFIAPIDTILIDGEEVMLVQQSAGPKGLGPFIATFSREVDVGDSDTAFTIEAENAAGNKGSVVVEVFVEKLEDPDEGETVTGRIARIGKSVPESRPNLEDFAFRIEVIDEGVTGNEVFVTHSSGIDVRTLTLKREDAVFLSDELLLVPSNAAIPPIVPAAVRQTRFKGAFGLTNRTDYVSAAGDPCEVEGIPCGVLFVAPGTAASAADPIGKVTAGTKKDVGNPPQAPVFGIEVGAQGSSKRVQRDPESGRFFIETAVRSLDFAGNRLAQKQVTDGQIPPLEQPVVAFRASDDSTSPDFNLFRSDPLRPLLAIHTLFEQDNPSLTEQFVEIGGFLSVKAPIRGAGNKEEVDGRLLTIIGIDGMPKSIFYDQLDQEGGLRPKLQNFRKILGDKTGALDLLNRFEKGVVVDNVEAVFPTITLVNWASIFTGEFPNVTGIPGNEMFIRRGPNPGQQHIAFIGGGFPTDGRDVALGLHDVGRDPERIFLRDAGAHGQLANRTLRSGSEVETIYERAKRTQGATSVIGFNAYSRGVSDIGRDWFSPFDDPDNALRSFGRFMSLLGGTIFQLEFGIQRNVSELLDKRVADMMSTRLNERTLLQPKVTTVHFWGFDHFMHERGPGNDLGRANFYLDEVTDDEVADLLRTYKRRRIFDKMVFAIVADHGFTDLLGDVEDNTPGNKDADKVALELGEQFSADDGQMNRSEGEVRDLVNEHQFKFLQDELLKVLRLGGRTPLENEQASTENADVIMALNGGSASVYVRKREAGWSDLPDFTMDITPIAVQFFKENRGDAGSLLGDLRGAIGAILVRVPSIANGFNEPYQVVTGLQNGSQLQLASLTEFFASPTGIALGYINFPARMMQHGSDRSGDIILIPTNDSTNKANRYYFSATHEEATHGYPVASDTFVPLVFAFPGGDAADIAELRQKVLMMIGSNPSGRPSVTDMEHILEEILGFK